MPDSSRLYQALRTRAALNNAWAVVRDNGFRSTSAETRSEVKAFSIKILQNLDRIQGQLRRHKFDFAPARGILVKKKNKASERPVVIAPIPSRIVQRAILDVVQKIPEIHAQLHAGFNFGGIEGREFGVPAAVKKAHLVSQANGYYVRTDIKSFFTAVPRQKALEKILIHSRDPIFNDFVKRATDTELQDMESFGERAKLFPLADEGVAQGSCLSPLLCNLLLSEFDREMNDRGIVCIRYIDDFILLGSTRKKTIAAFNSALDKLHKLGLDAYDPFGSSDAERSKADHGSTNNGFSFLGCDISRERIRPSDKSRKALLEKISTLFKYSLLVVQNPSSAVVSNHNYIDCLKMVSNVVKGWGNTYSFCTDNQLMANIDIEINKLFRGYGLEFQKRISGFTDLDRRRVYGLFPLVDCIREVNPEIK